MHYWFLDVLFLLMLYFLWLYCKCCAVKTWFPSRNFSYICESCK